MVAFHEKLLKKTLKFISETYELDYTELKSASKKLLRSAKNYDEELLGNMEQLLDLSEISSEEELADFSIETLKIYCQIKEIDASGSDKSIRKKVWANFEEEFEESDDDESNSDDSEVETEPEPEPPPKKEKKKKEVTIIE